jgi:predicted transposase/invertase (TIGR01784 family)
MKTDKWFYELFLSQPGMLAELIPGVKSTWEFSYSAPVIKEKEFRFDGVFTPLSEVLSIPMVFAEAQMQTDEHFYRRFFGSIFLYLRQYEVCRGWHGLLILPSPDMNLGVELPYKVLLEAQVTRLYLSELREQQDLSPNLTLLQLLVTDQAKSAEIGKLLLQTAETDAEFERRLSLIETILGNKFPELTEEMIMQILDLKKMDITQSRFYQQIIQEGRQQGLQEGRQEGEAELVLRLLKRRLGELSVEQEERVRELSVEQLEDLGEALLDFTTMTDLEGHLAGLG